MRLQLNEKKKKMQIISGEKKIIIKRKNFLSIFSEYFKKIMRICL